MRSDILTKELMDLKDRFFDMDTQQQAIFLDLVDPQPEPQVAQKAAAKKPRKPRGKSARQVSLGAALKRDLPDRQATPDEMCVHVIHDGEGNGIECWRDRDNPIHDPQGGYAAYHEFQPPVQVAVGGGG